MEERGFGIGQGAGSDDVGEGCTRVLLGNDQERRKKDIPLDNQWMTGYSVTMTESQPSEKSAPCSLFILLRRMSFICFSVYWSPHIHIEVCTHRKDPLPGILVSSGEVFQKTSLYIYKGSSSRHVFVIIEENIRVFRTVVRTRGVRIGWIRSRVLGSSSQGSLKGLGVR